MPKVAKKKTAKPKTVLYTTAKKPVETNGEPRQLKKPKYQSFKMQPRIKQGKPLPGALRIFGGSIKVLFKNWKVFLGIVLIYGVLNVVLVRGFSGASSLSSLKNTFDQLGVGGGWSSLMGGSVLFVYMLGSAGNTASPTAGAYQLILTLVVSLALIWTLRQVYVEHKVRVRDGFYFGIYPLVTFFLVLVVIGIQMLPAALGVLAYSLVVGNGIAASFVEQGVWAVFLAGTVLVSLYMLTSSIFALYIVCLPEMTPMKALRSARTLVATRRFTVMRKILAMPLLLLLVSAGIVIPLILYATPAAPWVLSFLTIVLLPLIHSYMYRLYRALL